jgi:hypothetical protein
MNRSYTLCMSSCIPCSYSWLSLHLQIPWLNVSWSTNIGASDHRNPLLDLFRRFLWSNDFHVGRWLGKYSTIRNPPLYLQQSSEFPSVVCS